MESLPQILEIVSNLGTIGLLVTAIYLGLTGKVVSRFHYDEMKQAKDSQISYWRRKCGGAAADKPPTSGGGDG